MIKLTPFESNMMRIIKKWQQLYTNSPTASELSKELNCNVRNVNYAIQSLSTKGFIEIAYPEISNRRLIVVLFYE